jgi:hypothetical protein
VLRQVCSVYATHLGAVFTYAHRHTFDGR